MSASQQFEIAVARSEQRTQSAARMAIRKLLTNPLGLTGLVILIAAVFVAVLAPVFSPLDPIAQAAGDELKAPGAPYLLGTDEFGRDILSRLIYGTRISLLVALIAVSIGGTIGTVTGLITGYFGGWVDNIIMRIWDFIMSYPAIIIGIAIIIVIGPGTLNVAYALAIVNIPIFSRLMRARVLTERESDYVQNARSVGCRDIRIIFQHILPNTYGPILVQVSLGMGFAILLEAGLSFLGLGAQPPTPSWGAMLNDGRSFLRQAWWYSVFPGMAIAILVFGLNSLTDALRDALDPRKNV